MWDLLPGVALRSTPGYLISPLRGLRATFRHSRKSVESMNIKNQKYGTAEFTNEVQHYYDKVLSLWEKNIDISRWKTVVRLPDFVKVGNQSGKLQQLWIARHHRYRGK
jgi:hypothetical protein